MLDEASIETQTSPAARAAVIARALADERHRSIAFSASYLAFTDSKRRDVSPVIVQLIEYRYAPHLAPPHLRRLAAAVHFACEIASDGRPNARALASAGVGSELRAWTEIARRL